MANFAEPSGASARPPNDRRSASHVAEGLVEGIPLREERHDTSDAQDIGQSGRGLVEPVRESGGHGAGFHRLTSRDMLGRKSSMVIVGGCSNAAAMPDRGPVSPMTARTKK